MYVVGEPAFTMSEIEAAAERCIKNYAKIQKEASGMEQIILNRTLGIDDFLNELERSANIAGH